MSLRGSCLCGAVCYEVDQLDMSIGHCHCRTCRKAHASAYATTAGVLRDHFRWTTGEEKLRSYESSPGKLRRFCSECGSHLVAECPAQPHVILRVATLDDDPQLRPTLHIWTSHMSLGSASMTICRAIPSGNPAAKGHRQLPVLPAVTAALVSRERKRRSPLGASAPRIRHDDPWSTRGEERWRSRQTTWTSCISTPKG
jgi:ADP-ribosyl-[dinitrogen reductase] hydrolase